MRGWLIWKASWCQSWHKRNHGGADGCNEMTFCSSFPSTSLASSPPASTDRSMGRGVGWSGDASREMEWRQDIKTGLSNEWWPMMPFNYRCCILASLPISALALPSLVSLWRRKHSCLPPPGSSKVRRGGLAVSNEILSVRFQTFTKPCSFHDTGTRWREGWKI